MSDDAFQQLFPWASRRAISRAHAAVSSGAVASANYDDLVQEALIALWRTLGQFDPGRSSLRTFSELVISSRIVSAIRAARRKPRMTGLELATALAERRSVSFELRCDIDCVLNKLSVEDRRVAIALMYYSPMEASQRLGVARSTVYQHIARLRKTLTKAGFARKGRPPNQALKPACQKERG
jgi:RNA polymerase sigma factor (sigma-70 family)